MVPGQGYQLKPTMQMCFSTYLTMILTECLLWKLLRIMYSLAVGVTDNNMTVVIEDAAWDTFQQKVRDSSV